MTKEEEEVIKQCEIYINAGATIDYVAEDWNGEIRAMTCETANIEKLVNILKEKDKEIEKKDNAVKRIINRLDNDIKRITETKRDKSTFPNYLDDYTKCRLKAYRTKTKEIKEYIEEQYFERKATNDG